MAQTKPVFTITPMDLDEEKSPNNSLPMPEFRPKKPLPSVFSAGPLAHRYRYLILILGCACLTSINSNMITLNFTLICMGQQNGTNGLELSDYPQFEYTQHEKSMLMGAVAVGSIVGTLPFNYLYGIFGARFVFFFAGMVSAFSTLAIPFAAQLGFVWFLTVRAFQGLAYSADFAAIGVICSRWASLKQSGLFVSILTCFTAFSSSITNPVSGILCESKWGWPSVYYFHGTAAIILFSLWVIFYSDDPIHHKSVSVVELEKIHRNKSEAHIHMNSFVPYWEIIKDPVVLTVWLNALADIGTTIFLITYIPTYMNSVLNYSVSKTGILGALPSMMQIPFKLSSGFLSDKIKFMTEVHKLIFFNSIALFIPGVMYATLGYVPNEYPIIAVIIFTTISGFLGANCGGFYKMSVLIGRQYSGFIVANIQFIKCLTLFIAPALVAIFVTDNSNQNQWRTIFWIMSATLIISNTIFCFMATDQPGKYTEITKETAKLKKITNNNNDEKTRNVLSCC